jgi:hypothetical protein
MMYEVTVIKKDFQLIMITCNRNRPEQARREGGSYGRVIRCHKVSRDRILGIGSIEHMRLDARPVQVKSSPYRSAIAMDEMIGQKRNTRRANQYKDKNDS